MIHHINLSFYGKRSFYFHINMAKFELTMRLICMFCVAMASMQIYLFVSILKLPRSERKLRRINSLDDERERPRKLTTPTSNSVRPFPRWGKTLQDEAQRGMDFVPVLDFIVNSSSYAYITQQQWNKDTRYVRTTDHKDDVGAWLVETLYVIDEQGLSSSLRHRMCNAYGTGIIKTKLIPTEHAIMSALEFFKNDTVTSCQQWPRLCDAMLGDGMDSSTSGFPLMFFFGDFTGCNYHNYQNIYSIPLFTAAAHVGCDHAFPFPTHELLSMLRNDESEWDDFFAESEQEYPWSKKLSRVVWRGALTGPYVNDTFKNQRWNLVRTVHSIKNEFVGLGFNEEHFLFDVGAVRLPVRKYSKNWKNDLDEIGGLANRIDPMESNQKYRAILDVDGNSWSSRFNMLLCYNSVVLKVEPTWVDYLQFKRRNGEALQPWIHYIPVKADLSDLFEKAAFAMDRVNDELLQTIVHNANMWCRQRLVKRSIDIDILDIFERYIEYIDAGNPGWKNGNWAEAKKTIFSPDSALKMKLLNWDEDQNFGKAEAVAYKNQHGIPLHTVKIESPKSTVDDRSSNMT